MPGLVTKSLCLKSCPRRTYEAAVGRTPCSRSRYKTLIELQQATHCNTNHSRDRRGAPPHSRSRGRGTQWRPSTQTRCAWWGTQQLPAADWHEHKPRWGRRADWCSHLWLATPGCGLKLQEALLHGLVHLHDGRHVTCSKMLAELSAAPCSDAQTCQARCGTPASQTAAAVTPCQAPHHLPPASRGLGDTPGPATFMTMAVCTDTLHMCPAAQAYNTASSECVKTGYKHVFLAHTQTMTKRPLLHGDPSNAHACCRSNNMHQNLAGFQMQAQHG